MKSSPKLASTLVAVLALLASTIVSASTITCGVKTITLSANTITKIVHEDGTVHTGASISNNWTYDGKAITHRLLGERIPCGNRPKSRDELIAELSGQFSKDPGSFGMTPREASLMGVYTSKLMKQDPTCHLLVDAAKSTSRPGMFYIDCNDAKANTTRLWLSQKDLQAGTLTTAAKPVSSADAVSICNAQLKSRATNPATYSPSLLTGTSHQAINRTGRNVVEIAFETANAFGVVGQYLGRCILESGTPIEVTITSR
jgi:hypothetical protein